MNREKSDDSTVNSTVPYPKDFNTLSAAGNTTPRGIWSDETTMWVPDCYLF